MLVARILAALLVATLGVTGVMYLATRNPRWLRLSWQIIKVGLFILVIFLAFFALERFLLIL
jgi:hypothetical protein